MFLAFQRFPVSDRSPVADLCLSYRLRLCLSPFGYPASSWTACPCTDLYRMPNGLRLCLFPVWIPCPIIDCLPVYRPWTDLTTNSAAVFLYLDLYTCVWTADTCTKSETVKRLNCTYLCLLVVRLDPQSLLKALQQVCMLTGMYVHRYACCQVCMLIGMRAHRYACSQVCMLTGMHALLLP